MKGNETRIQYPEKEKEGWEICDRTTGDTSTRKRQTYRVMNLVL